MALPVVLLNNALYYKPGYIEKNWSEIIKRAEIRLTQAVGDEFATELAEADIVIYRPRRDYLGRDTMEKAPRLRGIVTPGVGVDKVDLVGATDLRIVVANSPGNSITMAEATITMALALAKGLIGWIDAARHSEAPTSNMTGMELYGKIMGLVGLGRIARYTAERARAFGMKVLAYDPYVQSSDLAELVSLDDLLHRSDFVSLHPILTPETFHMINAERLLMMKPTAYLINTSRGGVIDESALIEALRQGQIAGAGLDVFETEPPATDNPLLTMPNVIGTPHGLGHTEESFARCAAMTQENVLAIIDGKVPPYLVNRTVKWKLLKES